jgi:hypothetical protein
MGGKQVRKEQAACHEGQSQQLEGMISLKTTDGPAESGVTPFARNNWRRTLCKP